MKRAGLAAGSVGVWTWRESELESGGWEGSVRLSVAAEKVVDAEARQRVERGAMKTHRHVVRRFNARRAEHEEGEPALHDMSHRARGTRTALIKSHGSHALFLT